MKKNNKKGFTIIELVIVIGVIAILAGVLIPTFSSITQKAKVSAALQNATNALKVMVAEDVESFDNNTYYIKSGNYWFEVKDGDINETPIANEDKIGTVTFNEDEKVYGKTKPTTALNEYNFADTQFKANADLGDGVYVVEFKA